jgi:hypothetical protein
MIGSTDTENGQPSWPSDLEVRRPLPSERYTFKR